MWKTRDELCAVCPLSSGSFATNACYQLEFLVFLSSSFPCDVQRPELAIEPDRCAWRIFLRYISMRILDTTGAQLITDTSNNATSDRQVNVSQISFCWLSNVVNETKWLSLQKNKSKKIKNKK